MNENSIMESQSGLPLTLEDAFKLDMLEEHPKMLVLKDDSTILYLQKRNKVVTVTLCDSEAEIGDNVSKITQIADLEVTPESFYTNRFTFSADTLKDLLFEAEDVFEDLISTLVDLGGEIDTDLLIEKVLQIKKVYSTEYIFQTIRNMGAEDVDILLHTENPLTFFNRYISGKEIRRSNFVEEPYSPKESLFEELPDELDFYADFEIFEEDNDTADEDDED